MGQGFGFQRGGAEIGRLRGGLYKLGIAATSAVMRSLSLRSCETIGWQAKAPAPQKCKSMRPSWDRLGGFSDAYRAATVRERSLRAGPQIGQPILLASSGEYGSGMV